jgi:hypothetical protein
MKDDRKIGRSNSNECKEEEGRQWATGGSEREEEEEEEEEKMEEEMMEEEMKDGRVSMTVTPSQLFRLVLVACAVRNLHDLGLELVCGMDIDDGLGRASGFGGHGGGTVTTVMTGVGFSGGGGGDGSGGMVGLDCRRELIRILESRDDGDSMDNKSDDGDDNDKEEEHKKSRNRGKDSRCCIVDEALQFLSRTIEFNQKNGGFGVSNLQRLEEALRIRAQWMLDVFGGGGGGGIEDGGGRRGKLRLVDGVVHGHGIHDPVDGDGEDQKDKKRKAEVEGVTEGVYEVRVFADIF